MSGISKNIKIGRMDRRITFRQSTDTRSDSGATVESFADVATVWANVSSSGAGGNERFVMEKETSFNQKFFIIRYRTDLNEKMILLYENIIYDIKSINELEDTRKRFLKIQAEKRT
jgi:SPP1 family predicted phage head-tail adaptor